MTWLMALAVALPGGLAQERGFDDVLAEAEQAADDSQDVPIERRQVLEDPEEDLPGFNPFYVGDVFPTPAAPLRVGNNHQLNGLFFVPSLESAETLEAGNWAFRAGADVSSADAQFVDNRFFYNYNGTLLETEWMARYGPGFGAEIDLRLTFSELFGSSDRIILARDGRELVREGTRGAALSDVVLTLKKRLLWNDGEPDGLTGAMDVKFPIDGDRDNLLTSQGIDVSGRAIYSLTLGEGITAHAQLGIMIPQRDKVFLQDVTLRNPIFFGAGAAWKFHDDWVIIAQIQGHQSAFESAANSVAPLEGILFSVHGGVRVRIGAYFIDASIGTGGGDLPSDWIYTLGFEMMKY